MDDPGSDIALRARGRDTDASHDRRWNNAASRPLNRRRDVKRRRPFSIDAARNWMRSRDVA